MLPDYFSFYGIPISFEIDVPALKKTYYSFSKKYHPDFHTLEDELDQNTVLQLSSYNNKAYKTLGDFDLRMEYILRLKGILNEEGQNSLPQAFLMEMMDINEGLMEVQMDPDPSKLAAVLKQIDQIESGILTPIKEILTSYDGSSDSDLDKVKEYYLKKKYLNRLKEQVSNRERGI